MRATSEAFEDGGEIPEKHGYRRENTSPPLDVSGLPEDARSVVLIMDDPDAMEPAGKIWDHWLVWNLPAKVEMEEGYQPKFEGENDYGEIGYGGPNPPDGEHTYVFRFYALDTELELPGGAGREELEQAMEGHVVDEAELRGTYSPVS